MYTKITHLITIIGLVFAVSLAAAPVALAQTDQWQVGDGNTDASSDGGSAAPNGGERENWKNCGGAETSILACSSEGGEDTIIWILRFVVVLMTMGVGVLAVAGVVYAGVLYASAAGSQEQVKKAKMMLFNVALGLVAYAFMYAITNFLIPGGVIN